MAEAGFMEECTFPSSLSIFYCLYTTTFLLLISNHRLACASHLCMQSLGPVTGLLALDLSVLSIELLVDVVVDSLLFDQFALQNRDSAS